MPCFIKKLIKILHNSRKTLNFQPKRRRFSDKTVRNLLSLGHLKARFHDTRLLADYLIKR